MGLVKVVFHTERAGSKTLQAKSGCAPSPSRRLSVPELTTRINASHARIAEALKTLALESPAPTRCSGTSIYALSDAALVVSSDVNKGGTWAGANEHFDKLNLGTSTFAKRASRVQGWTRCVSRVQSLRPSPGDQRSSWRRWRKLLSQNQPCPNPNSPFRLHRQRIVRSTRNPR